MHEPRNNAMEEDTGNLLNELKRRYIDSGEMERLLRGSDISVLSCFLDNWPVIKQFDKKFYADGYPKVVLCGMNPGRRGSGKTGIPFIDFASLSKIMPGIDRNDSERSASFFFDIMQSIGVEKFYRNFYVTNISWLGYQHHNKNVNYDQMPEAAKEFVYRMFRWEMEYVNPVKIISLGAVVHDTVRECFADTDTDVSQSLPHPNYCAFPKNYDRCKDQYIGVIAEYMNHDNTR